MMHGIKGGMMQDLKSNNCKNCLLNGVINDVSLLKQVE